MAVKIQNYHIFLKNTQYFIINVKCYVSLNHKFYSKSLICNCSDKCVIEMLQYSKMVAKIQKNDCITPFHDFLTPWRSLPEHNR